MRAGRQARRALVWLALVAAPAAAQPSPTGARPPVFDVHLHASTLTAAMLAAMDSLNVTHAVLMGTQAELERPAAAGPRLLRSLALPCEAGRAPTSGVRCFADGSAFPPLDLLRRMAAERRLEAIGEVYAQYLGAAPDDPRMAPYDALAESLDVPVGIHLGIAAPGVAYAASRFPPHKSPNYSSAAGDPLLLETVLVRHPRLRVWVSHAAWPQTERTIQMLYMHPQLHVDVAALQWVIPRAAFHAALRPLVDAGFAGRIMVGSDGSARHLRMAVEAIREADYLTEQQRRDILYENAARFFRVR